MKISHLHEITTTDEGRGEWFALFFSLFFFFNFILLSSVRSQWHAGMDASFDTRWKKNLRNPVARHIHNHVSDANFKVHGLLSYHIFTYMKLYYLSAWFDFVSEIDLPNKLEKVISHMYIRGTGQRVYNQREKVNANYEVTQVWDGQVNIKTSKKWRRRSTQLLRFGICTLCRDIRLDWIFFENPVQDARIPFVIIGIIKDTLQQIVGECIMSSCAYIDRFENWWRKRKGRLNIRR